MLDRRLGRFVSAAPRSTLLTYGLILLALAALVYVVGVLGHIARVDQPTDFDRTVHAWIVAHRAAWPSLTLLMRGATRIGDPAIATPATLLVMVWLYRLHRRSIAGIGRSEAFIWLGSILGARYLGIGLKNLFKRERPPIVNRLVVETSYSFPSGHSVFAGAFYTMLAILLARVIPASHPWLRRAVFALCMLAAISIAVSRVWLGVHYPTDVLAGLLVGSTTAAGVWLVRLGWGHPEDADGGDRLNEARRPEDSPAGLIERPD